MKKTGQVSQARMMPWDREIDYDDFVECQQLSSQEFRQIDIQPRGLKAQVLCRDDVGQNGCAIAATVVDQERAIGINDEEVLHTRKRELALWLSA